MTINSKEYNEALSFCKLKKQSNTDYSTHLEDQVYQGNIDTEDLMSIENILLGVKSRNSEHKEFVSMDNNNKPKRKLGMVKKIITQQHLSDFPEPEYIIDRLEMEKGQLINLVGSGGTGKTFFSTYLALCVSTGSKLFGNHNVKKGRVLHLDIEQSEIQTNKRYTRVGYGLGIKVGSELVTRATLDYKLDEWLHFDSKSELKESDYFDSFVEDIRGYDMVIIDSLKKISCAEENNAEIEQVCNFLKRAAGIAINSDGKQGVCIILIHHKGKTDSGATQSGRGHSSIFDSCDGQADLDKYAKDSEIVTIRCKKSRESAKWQDVHYKMSDYGNIVTGHKKSEGIIFHEVSDEEIKSESSSAAHINAMDTIIANPNAPSHKLKELLKVGHKSLTAIMDHLENNGYITKVIAGNKISFEATSEGIKWLENARKAELITK